MPDFFQPPIPAGNGSFLESALSPQLQPPAPTPPAVAGPPKPSMRRFGDVSALRKLTYDKILNAASNLQPVQNQTHTLRLSNPAYAGPERYSLQQEKQAILAGQDLTRPLKGTWELVDNASGQVVDSKTGIIAHVPYVTQRGTFILGGNNYSLANQMRLRSGVFTRQKSNGEMEAHVNVMPGKGQTHRIFMDPETGVFRMQIGQARLPLVSALRAMGATTNEIKEQWGALADANLQKDDATAFNKLYSHFVSRPDPNADITQKQKAFTDAFEKMELDSEVTKRTLGNPYGRITKDTLFAISKKLLDVSNGIQQADDRDAMAYQTILGPEDLFSERIGRSAQALRAALWKATKNKNLQRMPSGIFTKALQDVLMNSGLGQPGEEINPLQVYDQQGRVSRMGMGGIPSLDAIPDESRSVQPSHLGFIDPIVTPESSKVGVDSRFASATMKGDDGRIYTQFRNLKTGQMEWKSAQDMTDAVIAFPGELNGGRNYVRTLAGGRLRFKHRDEVEYELPNFEDAFSTTSNMVPMKSAMKGQRGAMAQRMLTQALPLIKGEAPLVQSGVPDSDESYEERYAEQFGAIKAAKPGRVTAVSPDEFSVQYYDGTTETFDLYNNFPNNRKTALHQTPMLQVGETFQPKQLLVRSNFVDPSGAAALGVNAKVAYIPWKGENFEDAISISESFAKRTASEHMYQHELPKDSGVKVGRANFIGTFPSKYDRRQLDVIDDDGVVQVGTEVHPGDPLVLATKKRDRTAYSLHQSRTAFADNSETWDHHSPGIVTDVTKTPKGVLVTVKSLAETQVGDKLSNRYGGKGVSARIIPDDEMPRDKDGVPFEVLLNPLGIISRSNPAQVAEVLLGKVAAITGKPYKVQDFKDIKDIRAYARQELLKHGLEDQEDIFDPKTGRKIPGILTGNTYIMKLHHVAESKAAGRGTGGYTAEGLPAKGGPTGSKRLSLMHVHALLSHGATETIRDAHLNRGQANPEHWRMVMSGYDPPTADTPLIFDKFVASLKGSGINLQRTGSKFNVMALTNSDIDTLAEDREITGSETVNWKDRLKPVPGGLFDLAATGGTSGNRWAKIRLHEPMPNPVMEEPIRRILGLTKNKFMDILAGRDTYKDKTGPEAIASALKSYNVERELERCRADIAGSRKTARDAAIRKLGYLKSAQALGLHPGDWVLNSVPVLPPVFRPVSVMQGSKLPMVADANYLYKELIDANNNLREMAPQVEDLGDEREAVYNAFKAVTGLGDPIHPKNQERKVKGLLRQVLGSGPKHSIVQRKLLGVTTDMVGRGTIVPDPDLDMDEVGIPESQAWEVYQPLLVRRLVRRGMSRVQAVQAVKGRRPEARKALLDEMEERPVTLDRSPVLWKYGIMAFRPKLVADDTIHVSPMTVAGFGADFDGDQQIATVIVGLQKSKSADTVLKSGKSHQFWSTRKMSARFDLDVPYRHDFDFYVVNLEDFPHGHNSHVRDHITFFDVPPGIFVFAYDEAQHTVVLTEVSGWSKHLNREVVIVDLRSGRQILTDDDERAVYGIDTATYQFTRKRPGDAVGMCVPRVQNLPIGPDVSTALHPEDPHRLLARIDLTQDVGWLFGALAGNGWVTHHVDQPRDLCLATSSTGVRAQFGTSLSQVLVDPPTIQIRERTQEDIEAGADGLGTSRRYIVSCVELARFVKPYLGRGARFKHLPPFYLDSPEAFRRGLVAGLLDTDGSISVSTGKSNPQLMVSYTSSSLRLVQEIQLLLMSLNVSSRITPTKTPAGEPFWALGISAWQLQRANITVYNEDKKGTWENFPLIAESPATAKEDVVPFPRALAGAVAGCFNKDIRTANSGVYSAISKAKTTGLIGRQSATKLLSIIDHSGIIDPAWEMFKQLVENKTLRWDIVESFTFTGNHETGYDLTVPGTETFMAADGIVLSNTMQFHVPSTDAAAKEVLEKLLPSRNLLASGTFRVHQLPSKEYVGGLYSATAEPDDAHPVDVFETEEDALRAYKEGRLPINRRVRILKPSS